MTARAMPVMPNFFAGQKLTGTLMNQVAAYGVFGANPPMVRAYQTISQPITSGTDAQITTDTRDYDTDSIWQATTPYSLIVPAGMTGRWCLTWSVATGVNASGARDAYIKRNGNRISGAATAGAAADNDYVQAVMTTTILLNAGDVLGLWFWQNSGSTLSTTVSATNQSIFEARLISLANP